MTGDRRRWLVVAAGVALGVALVLSPMATLGMAALALLVREVVRGLSGPERNLVLAVVAAAVLLRVAFVAGLFVTSDPGHLVSFPFDGDGRYIKLRSLWIMNVWRGVPIDFADFFFAFDEYGWSSYIYLVAYLQYLLGPAPYAIHLFSIICFLAAAILVHRLARRAYGPLPGFIALALTLFMPTLFMWSVAAMKESWYLFLIVLVVAAVERAVRCPGVVWKISAAALALAAALAAEKTRTGALVIVAGGTAVACAGVFLTRRPYLFALVAILALPIGGVLVSRPAIHAMVMKRIQTSAVLHLGHVRTEGHAYKLLDERFYSGNSIASLGAVKTMTGAEAVRYGLRGALAFLFVPLPWQTESRAELLFLPQQLAWYVLLVLAAAGIVKGARVDTLVTWLFLGITLVAGAVIAPHEGNIGTLVRHRDAIVPFAGCLAGLGALALWRGRVLKGAVPVDRPGAGRSRPIPAVEASALGRVIRESKLCAAVVALCRPSLDARYDPIVGGDAVIQASTLTRLQELGPIGAAVARWVTLVGTSWRESSVVVAVAGWQQVDRSARRHMLGVILVIGATLAVAAVRFGDYAWPTQVVIGAIGFAGMGVILASRTALPPRSGSSGVSAFRV